MRSKHPQCEGVQEVQNLVPHAYVDARSVCKLDDAVHNVT
jgi:hypothetical protein